MHVEYIIFHGLITNNQDMASEAEWSVVVRYNREIRDDYVHRK
jgi:hypothetical protein